MSAEQDQVFIIRFWHEPMPGDDELEAQWRARIRYVNDRRELHANSIEEAFAIVRTIVEDEFGGQP